MLHEQDRPVPRGMTSMSRGRTHATAERKSDETRRGVLRLAVQGLLSGAALMAASQASFGRDLGHGEQGRQVGPSALSTCQTSNSCTSAAPHACSGSQTDNTCQGQNTCTGADADKCESGANNACLGSSNTCKGGAAADTCVGGSFNQCAPSGSNSCYQYGASNHCRASNNLCNSINLEPGGDG